MIEEQTPTTTTTEAETEPSPITVQNNYWDQEPNYTNPELLSDTVAEKGSAKRW